MTGLQTLIAFLAALTLLIFVHELGHYLVARWCGVKVLRFSIGFGKPLLRWHVGKDRTEWTLAAIPLGGYVRMLDERESDAPIEPAELSRAFSRKSLPQRSAIVAAGPLANFLLAILLYAILGWVGVDEPAPIVDRPAAETPAARAGLERGDRILSVDGGEVRSWNELRLALLEPVIERRVTQLAVRPEAGGSPGAVALDLSGLSERDAERDFLGLAGLRLASGKVVVGSLVEGGAALRGGLATGDELVSVDGAPIGRATDLIDAVKANPGREIRVVVRRGADEITLPIVPQPVAGEGADEGRTIGRIGAALQDRVRMETLRYGPLESLWRGAVQTWDMSVFTLRMLGKMLTGELSIRNLSGPVTIADLAGQSARVGWFAYLSFLALISISLGVLNLLPVPVLDGGHLVYYGLEAVKGRPLSERFIVVTQKAGLAVIMLMMVVALFNDISRLIGS
ncbi:RIP metalloprotease RseP [Burkholderiaceae bacterium FT117]|uniref:RIP metalloprotease RseP n=1 Tax=Zeimonas sediminis TaxID=2944268 RepID=UPI002342DDC8|nr:RIP metalloprotease RseP [Zeimonas sediminis]MCM5569191.1 RIP metalloprotease RseP [Zeimonas sediminis]